MRVLALGGAGAMGVHACRTVAKVHEDAELIVADLDAERAAEVAASLGDRARSIGLDVTDAAALTEAIRRADVVMNTVGPFFRFGVPILRAAIAQGRDYVDICDDWEPTVEMLGLNEAAKAAGSTALVGMGASPGVSNLLAVSAARELDRVDEIITGWDLTTGGLDAASIPGVPSAAVVHAIEQITGTIRVTRGGRPVDEPALRRTRLDYPGVGRRRAWTFGHPEALTMPAAFPSVTTSLNVAFGDPAAIAGLRVIRAAVDLRLVSARRAALIAERVDRWSSAKPAFRGRRLPPLFGLAIGARHGEPASVGCALAQIPGGLTMGEVTGIPLGVAIGLLAGARPGVGTPETLLDPGDVYAALAPHCIGDPDPASMVVTTRSWEAHAAADLHDALDRAHALLV